MLSKYQILRKCLTCTSLTWPIDIVSFWESDRAQVAILRDLSQLDRINPPLEMLGGFPTLVPKTSVSACFLVNCFSHSSKSWLLAFCTVWSLPVSIRTTIGPRINKQDMWLGAIPTTGNEEQLKIWPDPSQKLLTDPNPGPNSKTSDVPALRQGCLPHCPGQANSSHKRRK